MGGKGGGRIGTCELQAREEGGEADKGGYRGAGIGAPGACCVGEHVVVRALEGDAPLFVAADFFVARDHVWRARTRLAAGSRTSRATTLDLATQTYCQIPSIICTGAAKTAQITLHAHGVRIEGWEVSTARRGQPTARA